MILIKHKYISYLLIFLTVIPVLLNSYSYRGNWILNQNLAMLERVDSDESYFKIDNFSPSTVYFPGLFFVTRITSLFTDDLRTIENILLIFPSLFFLVFLLLISHQLSKIKVPLYFSSLMIFLFFVDGFYFAQNYIAMLKPDIITMVLAIIALNISQKQYSSRLLLNLFIVLFIAALFKQQAVAFYLSFLFIFFKQERTKEKITILIVSGFFLIFILSFFENSFLQTIIAMKHHGSLPFNKVFNFLFITFNENRFFWISLIVSLYFLFKSNAFKKELDLKNWIILSIPWVQLQFLSLRKVGGNVGNSEIGLVILLPLCIWGLYQTNKNFKSYRVKYALLIILIAIFSPKYIKQQTKKINHLVSFYTTKDHKINFLSKYKNLNAAIHMEHYIFAKEAGIRVVSDYSQVNHLKHLNLKYPKVDIIIGTTPELFFKSLKFNKNYRKVENKYFNHFYESINI